MGQKYRTAVAAALLAALLALSSGVAAQQAAPLPPPAGIPPAPPPGVASPDQAARAAESAAVERRIASLRRRLHITAEQLPLWDAVAQAMRDEAATVSALMAHRVAAAGPMSAVEDLRQYQQVAQAHVEGLQMLVPAFEKLYAALTPEQQKAADSAFRPHRRRHSAR
jgi:periplasmic protein CpxP/Spy